MQILLPADASETPAPPAPTANCRCGVEGWPTVSRNNRIVGGQKYNQVNFPFFYWNNLCTPNKNQLYSLTIGKIPLACGIMEKRP